jgi:predicted dehydrogenase
MLDFRISWAMNMDTCGDALILGTKGGLRIPSTECWNGEFRTPLTVYKNVAGKPVSYQIPLQSNGEGPTANLFYKKIRSFVDAVKEGGEPTVPTSQGIINQAIIDGLCRSAELGHEVEIVIPEI